MKTFKSNFQGITDEQVESACKEIDGDEITLINIYMRRNTGYGTYKIAAKFIIDGKTKSLQCETNDSMLWDDYADDEPQHFDSFAEMYEHLLTIAVRNGQ